MIDEPLRTSRISRQIRAKLILSLVSFSPVFLEAEILGSESALLLGELRRTFSPERGSASPLVRTSSDLRRLSPLDRFARVG